MVIKRSVRRHKRTAQKNSSSVEISAKRKAQLSKRAKKIATTMKSPLNTYRDLERKIDKTWKKLRNDVKRKSLPAIIKGKNELLLLLGECNYMARECARYLTE